MKSRIEYIIKKEGLSNQRFAGILGVSPGSIAHILSGRNNPSIDMIARIALNYPDYSLRWLILGEEPIIRASLTPPTEAYFSVQSTFVKTASLAPNEDNVHEQETELLPQIHTKLSGPYAVKMSEDCPSEACRNIASTQDRLIICYPDKTFDEYSRR